MKIPWTHTHKKRGINLCYLWLQISWNYPDSRYYLIISLVRCRSFPSSNADTQAACLSLDGQGVLQVREGGVSTTTNETPRNTTQLRTDWEGGEPTFVFLIDCFFFLNLKLCDKSYGWPPSFCQKMVSVLSQQHPVIMPTDGWRDNVTFLEPYVSLSGWFCKFFLQTCFTDIL